MTIQTFIKLFISMLGIVASVVFGIWFFAYLNSIIDPTPIHIPKPPDTTYVPKKLPIDTVKDKDKEIPKKVTIYLPDTAFREKKEKDTLLIDVKTNGNKVTIIKMDPKGVLYVEVFKIDKDAKGIHIDHRGHLQQKKRTKLGKFLRKAKWYAIGTVAAAATITVAILLK